MGGAAEVSAYLVGTRYAMDFTCWLRLGRGMSIVMRCRNDALLCRHLAGEDKGGAGVRCVWREGGEVGAYLVATRYAMDVTWWLRLDTRMSIVIQ